MEDIDQNENLREFEKINSAGVVAGMLINKTFHSNTLRIEALLHHIISDCAGSIMPTNKDLEFWLNEFPPIKEIHHLEDPVEDTFISRVSTPWGDYRIYGGIWEGYSFCLQRVINIIQTIPESLDAKSLVQPIKALLSISERIAERNNEQLNELATSHDKEILQLPSQDVISQKANTLYFSEDEINDLGLSLVDLGNFILPIHLQKNAKTQVQGTSDLVRCPLIQQGNGILVIVPTNISWAIRIFVFTWLKKKSLRQRFHEQLILEYVNFLRDMTSFEKFIPPEAPFKPIKIHEAYFLEYGGEIDPGRHIHLLIRVDTLHGFDDHGITEPPVYTIEQSEEIERRIKRVKESLQTKSGFREGITLIIMAGYGRTNMIDIERPNDSWIVGAITAEDLETITWTPGTTNKTIWKFLEHQRHLEDLNVKFINPNGLLNLYGWWEESDHIFIPSKVTIGGEGKQFLYIPTDCIARLRQRAWKAIDHRTAQYVDGSLKHIRKKNLESFFEDENKSILYGSFTDIRDQKLVGCALTAKRTWWLAVSKNKSLLEPETTFRIWDALHNWMEKIALTLDLRFESKHGIPILFVMDVSGLQPYTKVPKNPPGLPNDVVDFRVVKSDNTVFLLLKQAFLYYLNSPVNYSERGLVKACVDAFLDWAQIGLNEKENKEVVDAIVPNDGARYIHLFQAKNFRELTSYFDNGKYEIIDNSDASILKIGLGHYDSSGPKNIAGRQNCTDFLNKLVAHTYRLLRNEIVQYDKSSLIVKVLSNIEGVAADKSRWQRTAKAVLDLSENKEAVYEGKAKHFSSLHAADIACRIIAEIALCEACSSTGLLVGSFDLSPLMAKASMIFHLGNISDGIDKGVIAPEIVVTPSGDVLTDQTFQEEVMDRVASQNERENTKSNADDYETHFRLPDDNRQTDGNFSTQFTEAFIAEFGVSVKEIPFFLEEIENIAMEREKGIYVITQNEILEHCKQKNLVGQSTVLGFLRSFSLKSREKWEIPPSGYTGRDINPWLFRRRLSLLLKPILKMDESQNPTYLISPGFCLDAFVYTVDTYLKCGIEEERCNSDEMKKWIGDERARRGKEFTLKTATVLRNQGFKVKTEIRVSSIIPNHLLDKDYGDVDIIAWKNGDKSIHLIECKDLLYAKTFKEIAEQLQEFKGKLRDDKPDRLKKHLNRIDILNKHQSFLTKFCEMDSAAALIPYVVFSNPVPSLYDKDVNDNIKFRYFDEIENIGF